MRKIAILNFKGGTGKTTTAVNLGHALTLNNQRVIIVDSDAQGSMSGWFGINPEKTLFDLLSNQAELSDCIYPVRDNLDIIASNKYLARIETISKYIIIMKKFDKDKLCMLLYMQSNSIVGIII